MMTTVFKIILLGEDGNYTLRDMIRTYDQAEKIVEELQPCYEGELYIYEYCDHANLN